ncbi:hypothetical protein ABZ297_08030 [Nonomuraea sp. NPDC005983]|uniref:hypothetical protein n=1 Tax=Nonomuraea sp. NPDC005983 TaxID=3155595 RepID=UPI0033BACBCA
MSKRSRKRRALTGGAPSWRPGFGPGEPHGPGEGDPPSDDPPGGVREPRRPKPAPPSLTAEAVPEPPLHAHLGTVPSPDDPAWVPALG